MTIDLKLPSNEILHFTGDAVVMNERDKIPGLLNSGLMSPFSLGAQKSPFVRKAGQRRYDLAEIMN